VENPLRVLVVDDDPAMCGMLVDSLEAQGHEARAAHSVGEALRLLEQQRFTVVLSDVHMPSRSGFELLDELKSRDVDVPVILMSSFGSPETARQASARGALAFLSKPFDSGDLTELLLGLKDAG
jgi:DNA-binding NtrC family response regulator